MHCWPLPSVRSSAPLNPASHPFAEEQCDEFVAAAVDSATLAPSKVGGGNLRDLGSLAANSRRTSTSVLVDGGVQAAHPRLAAMAAALQARGLQVGMELG